MDENKPVIVTTEWRGVFYGRLKRHDEDKRIVELTGSRNIRYWPPETGGFIGLATKGPLPGAKVGPAVGSMKLWGVTSVLDCDGAAIAGFEK